MQGVLVIHKPRGVLNLEDACHNSAFGQSLLLEGCTAAERLVVNTQIVRPVTFDENATNEVLIQVAELINQFELTHNHIDPFQTKQLEFGSLALPNGTTVNSWPVSKGFFHIDESGHLSDAMINVFLPIRAADFGDVLLKLEAVSALVL